MELLYARSNIVTAARTFGLAAIDMASSVAGNDTRRLRLDLSSQVCVDYKDPKILQEEAEEGRRLGFDGKVRFDKCACGTQNGMSNPTLRSQQAIHPSQVETIRKAFAPSEAEVYRAALILYKMETSTRGAEGVRGKDGKEEMIDKPMVLQASSEVLSFNTLQAYFFHC